MERLTFWRFSARVDRFQSFTRGFCYVDCQSEPQCDVPRLSCAITGRYRVGVEDPYVDTSDGRRSGEEEKAAEAALVVDGLAVRSEEERLFPLLK